MSVNRDVNAIAQAMNNKIYDVHNPDNGANVAVNRAVNPLDIFNALKIPDVIKDLPKFESNPRLLYEFINNVEEILFLMAPLGFKAGYCYEQ